MAQTRVPDLNDDDAVVAESPPATKAISPSATDAERRATWLLRVGMEVILITLGVFLAR